MTFQSLFKFLCSKKFVGFLLQHPQFKGAAAGVSNRVLLAHLPSSILETPVGMLLCFDRTGKFIR
jgi:hypothetical protein